MDAERRDRKSIRDAEAIADRNDPDGRRRLLAESLLQAS
jgi:hypothetical protein